MLAAEAASWGIDYHPLIVAADGPDARIETEIVMRAVELCEDREVRRQNRMQNAVAQAFGGS